MLRRYRYLGCLITLLVVPHLSSAQAPYKWRDSQGRIHYGDRPPPDQAVEAVKVPPSPVAKPAPEPTASTGAGAAEPAAGSRQQDAATSPDAEASSRQLMQENCKIAQRNREILTTSGRRVHAMDAGGNLHTLDDKERELKLSETQKQIEQFCQ